MIAQGDFQKLLLAGTEERGNIFRQIFKTGLYQTLQGRLKDAVRTQWVEYSELKRSISQYMESIVCVQDTPAAEKMRRLHKEKFDGRVGEGLEVLGQLCREDETVLNELDQKIGELDKKIEKENQLIGNIHKIRQQQEELSKNQELLEQLAPQLEQAAGQYREAEQNAAECGQLALAIKEQQKNLALFDKLRQEQETLASIQKTISQETIHKQELEEQQHALEASLKADSETLKALAPAGEEKARLENKKTGCSSRSRPCNSKKAAGSGSLHASRRRSVASKGSGNRQRRLLQRQRSCRNRSRSWRTGRRCSLRQRNCRKRFPSRKAPCSRCRHSSRKTRTGCGRSQIPLSSCAKKRYRSARCRHSAGRRLSS